MPRYVTKTRIPRGCHYHRHEDMVRPAPLRDGNGDLLPNELQPLIRSIGAESLARLAPPEIIALFPQPDPEPSDLSRWPRYKVEESCHGQAVRS